jgi:hypothetical protein
MNVRRMCSNTLVGFLLAIALVLGQFGFLVPAAEAASGELVITGSGVKQEVLIGQEDWDEYIIQERIYSTNNSLGFHKIVKVKGYDLLELIGEDNLKDDQDYVVDFLCADGFKFQKTISELWDVYTYTDFTESTGEKVGPMLARHSAVLADFPQNIFSPPVQWEDRALTEADLDDGFPKLTFGQTGIDDMNMSRWGKEVVKITVGDEPQSAPAGEDSPYRHLSYEGAPYNIDAISGATFTIEGPGVKGYRAISLRQIEEDLEGHERVSHFENIGGEVVENTYEGINAGYLIDNYVKAKDNAGNITFKNKSRQTILTIPIQEAGDYTVAFGINEVPYVYLDTDVGFREDKYNDNGCFKLVYGQDESEAKEFSNVAYIYIEEKDAKNIYEHTYGPYEDPSYTDYELIIHGDAMEGQKVYMVSEIEKMNDIMHEDEYSLSNSEYFWYYNTYKGVKLLDLLEKAGMDENLPDSTTIQFIAADNYNFAPMTLGEIRDYSLYGYYEKDAGDLGDGSFDGKSVEPISSGQPPLVAYGFNGYPYVISPTDEGYNPGLGNDGGPIRVIFGKTGYNDTNGSNQVQFLKEIIVGGGEPVSTGDSQGPDTGEETMKPIDPSSSWNHNRDPYMEYLDQPVLRITGSQIKEPVTLSLRQVESLTGHALKDIYSGDGVREFEGVILWDLISKVAELEDDVETPSIRVFSGPNYNQVLRSADQVINGVVNSKGQLKKIILAYAVDGYPLVPDESSIGYAYNNAYGPLRLIIEENKSMWVKWTDCIVVGTGDYEKPMVEDIADWDVKLPGDDVVPAMESEIWIDYRNNTGREMTEASVRAMEFDKDGNLWIGTNKGGISVRSPEGKWSHINSVNTAGGEMVKVDTSYAIVQRDNGQLWIANGGPTEPRGILVLQDDQWTSLTKESTGLPACFVQELEDDGKGGIWIGTQNGLAHVDSQDNWKIYTQEEGLLPYSVDALEPDGKGGVWIGYYPDTAGTDENPEYLGGYQHLSSEGELTTYEGFDSSNFNINWVRRISMDVDGGVWITRSGNAPGFSKGEADYIKDGERTVYTAMDLYPGLREDSDIRMIIADENGSGVIYIATKGQGVVRADLEKGQFESYSSDSVFPSRQWDDVYFVDCEDDVLMVGSNGGAALRLEHEEFQDSSSHWAREHISKMSAMGYVKGDGDAFRPNDSITRAEFVTLVTRIIGADIRDGMDNPFTDIGDQSWYRDNVLAAADLGIVGGYPDGSFRPDGQITRAEIAAILGKLYQEEIPKEDIDSILSGYSDSIPRWAWESVAKVTDHEIIKGFPDGSFGGARPATRAEAAVMLYRYLKD